MLPVAARRDFLKGSLAVLGAGVLGSTDADAAGSSQSSPAKPSSPKTFRTCLNTSTIRGQGLTLVEEIDLAGEVGYDGIEPWIREIQAYQESGGSLIDLRKRIADRGLTVESVIGFANWIVDDPQKREQGLNVARRDMHLVAQIGGTRIAAPPAGATKGSPLDLDQAAIRYADLLEVGRQAGVTPMLELWGFSANLSRVSEVLHVAAGANHPDATLLLDAYHLYKGGNASDSLKLIGGHSMKVFHINDYPEQPGREQIGDADRVFPGLGVAPLVEMLTTMSKNGFQGALSLELFNREYWSRDAHEVARQGRESMLSVMAEVDLAQG